MIIVFIITLSLFFYYIIFINDIRRGLRILFKKNGGELNSSKMVSIVIPFRNESSVIEELVDSINNLTYSQDNFEVLFVDDNSEDDTSQKLSDKIRVKNWKIISGDQNNKAHKKLAVTTAVNNSIGEIILMTDADCIVSKNWIAKILQYFDDSTAMVSGPVTFADESSIFKKLQKLEFSGLALTGAGLIGIGKPTICSAANLAFRKSVFFEVGGYADNINLSSGDDELLMQKIAAKTNYEIKYCFENVAIVYTRSNESFSEFKNQRKRWASKSLFYKNKRFIISLVVIFLFYFSLLLLPVFSVLIDWRYSILFVIIFSGKMLVEFSVMKYGSTLFFNKRLLKYFMVAELLHVPYIVFSALGGLFGGYTWKGREVRR